MTARNTKQATISTDVLIIGAGLAGLTLANVLSRNGFGVVIVDRDAPPKQLSAKFDGRTTAISWASHRVLTGAGVWQNLLPQAAPILDIRVAEGQSPLFLHFSAEDHGEGRPFGWIVENRRLRQTLIDGLDAQKNVKYLAPVEIAEFFHGDFHAGVVLKDGQRIKASLIAGADGRGSPTRAWLGIDVRQHDYNQTALVFVAYHELDHENVAVEHFLPAGPFAALPMRDDEQGRHRSSIVWSLHGEEAGRVRNLVGEDFRAELQKVFGPHLGRVDVAGDVFAYPLSLLSADRYIGPRVALLAEAAHAMHPIAGQGLNLSMRDIAALAELLVDQAALGLDIGQAGMLERYEELRKTDIALMLAFTDGLNRLFSNDLVTATAARSLGLGIIEKIDPLKRFFARQAMGFGGRPLRLVERGHL